MAHKGPSGSKEIDIDPTHALAYYNRGVARFAKWDLDGALADFNASLTINPDHAEAYYNRASLGRPKLI
jgi:serine/threonine-protein kinase